MLVQSLSTNISAVFFYIGAFATLFFIVKLILFSMFGGDIEVQTDFETMTDCDISFNYFSVQAILAFLMGFGWSGMACIEQLHIRVRFAILVALFIGAIFLYVTAWTMFMIRKLEKVVKVDLKSAVGTEGKAYTDLKPHEEGQIQIVINKKLETIFAINNSDEYIKAFEQVKVVEVNENKLYVEKI